MTQDMNNYRIPGLVTEEKSITSAEVLDFVNSRMKDGFGLVTAWKEVFFCKVTGGKIELPPRTGDDAEKPENWAEARFFNSGLEIRLRRSEGAWLAAVLDDSQVDGANIKNTRWLLAGARADLVDGFREMREFQVQPFFVPEQKGSASVMLSVNQYIEYDADGMARIVTERLTGFTEEVSNG